MNSQTSKFITILVATVSAGIPIWTVSGRDLNLTDPTLLAIWCVIGIAVTFIMTLVSNIKANELIGAVTVGFALALVIRFLGDMFTGTTRHALLGLELLIAVAAGAVSAWLGTLIIAAVNGKKEATRK